MKELCDTTNELINKWLESFNEPHERESYENLIVHLKTIFGDKYDLFIYMYTFQLNAELHEALYNTHEDTIKALRGI